MLTKAKINGINMDLLLKVNRNRIRDRDIIKEYIKNNKFYKLWFDFTICEIYDQSALSRYDVLINNTLVKEKYMMVGESIVSSIDYNVRPLGKSYLKINEPIFLNKDEDINIELIDHKHNTKRKIASIIPEKQKYKILYKGATIPEHNFPSEFFEETRDVLEKIIVPKVFTGRKFKLELYSYDTMKEFMLEYECKHNTLSYKDLTFKYYMFYPEKFSRGYVFSPIGE